MRLPSIGNLFQDRYRLSAVLGQGGFAKVYQARDEEVGRDVAIKILLPQQGGYRSDTAERFNREARVIARLQHPSTITMFDFGRTDGGLLYMVFEFVEGHDLEERLRNGALEPPVVIHILWQLLSALVEAHTLGVLHRDIKPANIILFTYEQDPNRAKLIDFGIAKPLVDRTGEPTTLTRDGMVVGTPRYMAPEQFFGEELTPASDIYSLGLVAYEMLVGSSPITGDNAQLIVAQQISEKPITVPVDRGTAALRGVVDKMVAREARARFPSAQAALSALQAAAQVTEFDQLETAPRAPLGARLPPQTTAVPSSEGAPTGGGLVARVVIVTLAVLALGGVAGVLLTQSGESAGDVELPDALTKASTAPAVASPEARQVDAGPAAVEADARPQRADGCGREVPAGRLRTFELRVGFTPRSWVVYTPRDYEPDERHPVVLLFHRTSRDAQTVLQTTRFADVADENGFVVLAFNTRERRDPWTDPTDIDLVVGALAEMEHELCLDRSRVYAVGNGSGGRFAVNLPCVMPISAVVMHGNGQYPRETICQPQPPVPLLRSYGTKDRDVPVEGGPGCMGGAAFMAVPEVERFWQERNECQGDSQSWVRRGRSRCDKWTCDATFVSCALDGGHPWPGGPEPIFALPACQAPIAEFPLADVAWRFFSEEGRSLPVAPRE